MSDIQQIERYFTHAAKSFDALYSEKRTGKVMNYVNRTLRSDVYERSLLTLNHIRIFQAESTLDVGCGSGRYEELLIPLGVKRMLGLDVSPTMIELAEERAKTLKASGVRLEFRCCDFLTFETSETFDVAIGMGLFDYVSDPVPFLEKMRAMCNHSLIASFPSVSLSRMPLRKARYYFKRCPVYFYKPHEITSYASRAGFMKVTIRKMAGTGMDYF